jgi:D-glycero-alpha-D-manno-heptose-7-phosphate kinase
LCGLEKDVELHNLADLPAFTGLGSSSAFTVSLLQALHSFKGEFLRPMELAYETIHVERNVLKENVGCQDQVLAAVGGFNLIEFRTETDIAVQRIQLAPARMAELERHLFIVFTGIRRKASEVVTKQLQRVGENNAVLRTMHQMVYEGCDLLTANRPWREFGELLHRAWLAKRSLHESVSADEIDRMYERGREAGAWGGKLLGAGGGGFLLFFAPPEKHENLRAAFANHQLLQVKVNAPGSQIIHS